MSTLDIPADTAAPPTERSVASRIWRQAFASVEFRIGLIVLTLLSFGGVAFAQALFPHWAGHPALSGLRVHLANGFYGNAVFDRLTGGWARPRPSLPTSERSPS